MPKLLIMTATGSKDPTRASLAFHLAVNGAVPAGQECTMVLAGDATELLKSTVAEAVRGVGVAPLVELLEACKDKRVRFYV